jgi:hypothetical protein
MAWKLILMRLPVGQRRERFHQRAERDGLGGVVPTGRQKRATAGIEEKIRNVAARELPFEQQNCGLAKKRFRRCGGILASKSSRGRTPGETGCDREYRDDQTCGYS